MPDDNVSQVEVELSFVWANNYPVLFVEACRSFQETYPPEVWSHGVNLDRKGFMVLKAKRRRAGKGNA